MSTLQWFLALLERQHKRMDDVPKCSCEVIEFLPRPIIPERRGSPLTAQKAVENDRRKNKDTV